MTFGGMGALWLVIAALLGVAELVVPGVFLIFIAAAAAVTGVVTLALPDLPIAAQLALLGFWSVVFLLLVRRWYLRDPADSTDPLLNDRGARLIGARVTVTTAIVGGEGRVRLADGEWLAHGPDLPAGAQAVVTACRDTTLVVEPLLPPPVLEN